jgi:plastocyanin
MSRMFNMRASLTIMACLVCTGLLVATSAAHAGPITGSVRTKTKPGTPAATAIVYAEPLDAPAPKKPGHFKLQQKNKAFAPRLLAIPAGSIVEFPNDDLIFHNVFSLSAPGPFDLGLYRAGASKSRTFAEPSTYRVFCNIHPQMTALIAVVPTPYVTLADASGAFTLDVPPGRYRLTAMSERATPVSQTVAAASGATTAPALELDESQFVQNPHKNKFGQDYPAAAWKP